MVRLPYALETFWTFLNTLLQVLPVPESWLDGSPSQEHACTFLSLLLSLQVRYLGLSLPKAPRAGPSSASVTCFEPTQPSWLTPTTSITF